MRTCSRAALLAAVLVVAGLGASACSKFGMLKGQMAFKDAERRVPVAGLQEGDRASIRRRSGREP